METIIARLEKVGQTLGLKNHPLLDRQESSRIFSALLRFALAFILSRVAVFDNFHPFGIAVLAATGSGLPGLFAFLGVLLGVLSTANFSWAIKYIAIGVLVLASNFVFQEMKIYKKLWVKPSISATIAFITGLVYLQHARFSPTHTIFFFTEIALIAGTTYFFQIALSPFGSFSKDREFSLKRSVSILILLSVCLIPLAEIEVLQFLRLGRMLAVFFLLCATYRGGLGAGSTTGAAFGLAMDAGLGGQPFFTMAYAFSGLFSGVFARHGKLLFVTAFVLANATTVLWTWTLNPQIEPLYEVFFMSMLFILLPNRVISKLSLEFSDDHVAHGQVRRIQLGREKVRRLSRAFGDLYHTVKSPSFIPVKKEENMASIFDRAAETACKNCPKTTDCWHIDYEDTFRQLSKVQAPMEQKGEVSPSDFPGSFHASCCDVKGFSEALNVELKAQKLRLQYKSRLKDAQEIMYSQYADMGAILAGIANQLDTDIVPEPFLERKLMRYLLHRNATADVFVYRNKFGRLHVQITGENLGVILRDSDHISKISSVLSVRLLEKPQTVQSRKSIFLAEAEPLSAKVGVASMRRRGRSVSGDRGSYFKTEDGLLYVILCDGMGTGFEAARESGEINDILEQFLQGGLEPGAALKLLNAALGAKYAELSTCASIDLLCVNLFTGESKLYKYGAAPSYIKKGTMVKAICGESLAAGLIKPQGPDAASLQLEPENMSVLISDGVLGEGDGAWLQEMLGETKEKDVQTLARNLLQAAIHRNGVEDDMTVLTILIEKRKTFS